MHIQPDVEVQPQDPAHEEHDRRRSRQLFGERSTSESEDDALPETTAQLVKSVSKKKTDKGKQKQQDIQAILDTSEEDDAAHAKEQSEVRPMASVSAFSDASFAFDPRKRKSQKRKHSQAGTRERALHVVERVAKAAAEFSTAITSPRKRAQLKQRQLQPAKSLLPRNGTSPKLPLPIHRRRISSTSPQSKLLPIASFHLMCR